MKAQSLPEWVYIEFGDWTVIYHHGHNGAAPIPPNTMTSGRLSDV